MRSLTFDGGVTEESFGGSTTYSIGWEKILFCNMGSSRDEVGNFLPQYIGVEDDTDSSRFEELAPYAITFKFTRQMISITTRY